MATKGKGKGPRGWKGGGKTIGEVELAGGRKVSESREEVVEKDGNIWNFMWND